MNNMITYFEAEKDSRNTYKLNNDIMIPVGVYRDSTGLYTHYECDNDNWEDEILFPTEIVRSYFYTNNISDEHTFEEWYKDEYTLDETDGLYNYAIKKGFYGIRPDGRDLEIEREIFISGVKLMMHHNGMMDAGNYMIELISDETGEVYGTEMTIGVDATWDDFINALVVNITEETDIRLDRCEIKIMHETNAFTISSAQKKISKEMVENIRGIDESEKDACDFDSGYLTEKIECARHNGTTYDLDCMINLNDILKFSISWELYSFINAKVDDIMECDKEDYLALLRFVFEYVKEKENKSNEQGEVRIMRKGSLR